MITPAQIEQVLPHRYPMLLVDRVVERTGERLTAIKAVTRNEPWYQDLPGHLEEDGYDYPAVLVLESWCQSAGLLAARPRPAAVDGASGDHVMLFGGVWDVCFTGRVRPGDVLEHHVRQVLALESTAIFEGECLTGGRVAMTVGRLMIAWRLLARRGSGPPRRAAGSGTRMVAGHA